MSTFVIVVRFMQPLSLAATSQVCTISTNPLRQRIPYTCNLPTINPIPGHSYSHHGFGSESPLLPSDSIFWESETRRKYLEKRPGRMDCVLPSIWDWRAVQMLNARALIQIRQNQTREPQLYCSRVENP